jgi:uncharacterized protein YjbI with pentapeptide repeats
LGPKTAAEDLQISQERPLRGWFLRRRAFLKRVDLSGANLSGANLSGADLSEAKLTQAQLEEASGDENTELPSYLERPAHWGVKSDEHVEGT